MPLFQSKLRGTTCGSRLRPTPEPDKCSARNHGLLSTTVIRLHALAQDVVW